jgi:hypothetical protein
MALYAGNRDQSFSLTTEPPVLRAVDLHQIRYLSEKWGEEEYSIFSLPKVILRRFFDDLEDSVVSYTILSSG